MPDLSDGESIEMKGSGAKPYVLKNTGGVYSCSCPAWRNQSLAIEKRTCKHLRKLRGDDAEDARVGDAAPPRKPTRDDGEDSDANAPPLLLAHAWDNSQDLDGWWMSEKLDGVRAYWDGKQFLSRLGNLYLAPDWFLEGLPDTPLDGELWLDRKKFQRAVSIARRQDRSDNWKELRFLVFDAPRAGGRFEDRLAHVRDLFAARTPSFAAVHEHVRCNGLDHLCAELTRVESLGGEGLMMREPGSKYEVGRSTTLLKVKTFHDAEAVVVGHQAGAGRHAGRLGALLVRLPDGIAFAVGTGFTDAMRATPPAVGSTITFRYQELTEAGVPRFPSFVGVRHDAGSTTALTGKGLAKSAAPRMIARSAEASARPESSPINAAPSTPVNSGAASGRRYFEFVGGTSSKFWEIVRSGHDVTVRYGRIGSPGQSKTKSFADDAAAKKHHDKLVAEKTGEGYIEKS